MGMAVSIPYYTVDDLENFPDDGNRYELLDGVLLVTPSPNQAHQVVAARLIHHLLNVPLGSGVRVVAPGVVPRGPKTQLEPDVLVYASRFPVNGPWSEITEHWLAVEIFSPGSRIYDREFKRNAYLRLGVKEVWLVDCDNCSVEISSGTSEHVSDVITWRPPTLDMEVRIDLADIFAGLE
jgi:Uma2 family endonuclease